MREAAPLYPLDSALENSRPIAEPRSKPNDGMVELRTGALGPNSMRASRLSTAVLPSFPFVPPQTKTLVRPLRSNRRWPDDVGVWRVDVAVDVPELANMIATLEVAEQQRALRYRQHIDRARYVSTRYVLRCLLSGWLGMPPQDLRLALGAHGKPYLRDYPSLSFNVSHSGLCALIAISYGRRVGIDVEYIDDTFDWTTVAAVVCSTAEQQALAKTASAERQRAFFRLWTAKEALFKGVGTGITIDLPKIAVNLPESGDKQSGAPHMSWPFADCSWTYQWIGELEGYIGCVAFDSLSA
jgi:4'-phosphopantetheinyl transferase